MPKSRLALPISPRIIDSKSVSSNQPDWTRAVDQKVTKQLLGILPLLVDVMLNKEKGCQATPELCNL